MSEIFKRSFRLKIQIGNVVKTYQELNYTEQSLKIDFDISIPITGTYPNGKITVSGLNNDDMETLASGYQPIRGILKQNFVQLEVGYINDIDLLYRGNIIELDPDFNTLGNSITFNLQTGTANNLTTNNISTSTTATVDFRAICNECAKNNGLSLNYDPEISNRSLENYSFNGTPFQQIEQLKKFYNDLAIFPDEKKDRLNVILKGNGRAINPTTLSSDTGLIGKPKPTANGLEVTSLLNTNFKGGGFVRLQNEVLKTFDGIYRIYEINHQGGNYSDTWLSKLILQRVNQ